MRRQRVATELDPPTGAGRWLEVAERIGARLTAAALWDGERCNWEVEVLDRASGRTLTTPAGAHVYQGSAGIALFLGELAAATGDAGAARAAIGGVERSLAEAAAQPPNLFGFHSGRSGVAWVAWRLGTLLDRPQLVGRAADLLAAMAGQERFDGGLDVISGAAGAVPVFLELGERLGRDDLTTVARRLGDHLLATARREPAGWSWGTVGPSATRNLAGYAHGACGVATALLELATHLGDGRFRFAAEMAFLYERRLYDAVEGNWPDLRHKQLNLLYYAEGEAAVAAADEAGEIGPYEPNFMRAWCHGSPGGGLARLRAWELTGREVYRREAEAAVESTVETLRPPLALNYSLCHGLGGNAELALVAAELLSRPRLAEVCHRAAEHGRRTFEQAGVPWSCGTAGGVNDRSLMLGEAGIGWFYLRLAHPEIPSVLLPRPTLRRAAGEDDGHAALAEEWVDDAFGLSRAAFTALGVDLGAASSPGDRESPLECAYAGLAAAVAAAAGERRELLADAFRVERTCHELTARPNDLTNEYRRRLRRQARRGFDRSTAAVAPAPDLRLVGLEHDWPGWLEARRAGGAAERPDPGASGWLVARLGDRLVVRPAGSLVAALLSALLDAGPEPVPLAELTARLAADLGGLDAARHEALAARLGEQAAALHAAGLVDVFEPPAAAGLRAAG